MDHAVQLSAHGGDPADQCANRAHDRKGIAGTSGSIMLMHMTANRKIMREFKVNGGLMIVGWIATAVMAGAATAMCFTTALSVIEM
jgi:Mn2+/Fe2+ NRAMP family transporter